MHTTIRTYDPMRLKSSVSKSVKPASLHHELEAMIGTGTLATTALPVTTLGGTGTFTPLCYQY